MARSFSDAQLLAAWDAGTGQTPTRRGLALLAALEPQTTDEALLALTVGQRNRRLLALYGTLAGPELEAQVTCPQCAAMLEFVLPVATLLAADPVDRPAASRTLDHDGVRVMYRLPTSRDLLAIEDAGAVATARRRLLHLCVLEAAHNGTPLNVADLPSEVCAAIEHDMEQRDPLAAIRLAMTCSECEHPFGAPLDMVEFVWAVVAQRARALLVDIHVLARAYGWSEAAILALSASRRRAYLEMAGA